MSLIMRLSAASGRDYDTIGKWQTFTSRSPSSRGRSAVMTFTRTVTVAAGVFAPGHPGELTWQVPFELADAVLAETPAPARRLPTRPSPRRAYPLLAPGFSP